MNIKTITTIGGVNEVDFGSNASRFYWFRNIGTTAVHVSGNADIVAGSDGVAELAAGDSVCIETLGGKVYVLGAGKVQIHNTGDKFCPFKNAPAAGGGGGNSYTKSESDAKYAQKTDIPSSLPANGGNADTVGGVGIANLRQITQTVINTFPAVPNGEADFFVNCDTSDTSFPYWYGHLSIRYGSYTGEYVAIFRTTGNDNKVYYNTYLTNHWSGWQEISATPIKSTTFSGTTNSYGDMLLFNKSEKKIPLFVSINDSYCIPLLSGSSDYYVHIINVDNTVAANVSKSGTLYYSEFKAVIV
ncbi:MAG: hypothetical protein MSA82_11275 [Oscillospiraceae bacterium]|nr:hypothetical protein [Oscillospiraceae bacterium]